MAETVITLVKIGFVLFCVFNLLYVLLWMERKQSAVMQDRIGANRAAIFGITAWGLFHPIADAIKMICKEDFMPAAADKFIYTISPFLAVFFALVGFAAIPFGNTITIAGRTINLQIADLNVGLLYVFAMLSLGVDLVRWYRTGGPDSPEQLGDFYAGLALGMVTSAQDKAWPAT